MITIIDYGIGNIQAFLTMFKRLGIPAARGVHRNDLAGATHLLLPGVGAFDAAMRRLNASGLRGPLESAVREKGVPIIGVCVGMQMLADSSEEGNEPGLGWIAGRVRAFGSDARSSHLPTPHMGWNDINVLDSGSRLFRDFVMNPRFYFLHSYYFDANDIGDAKATSSYGFDFACVVGKGHIHGVQFHPEKSHQFGAQLLKNFAREV